MSNTETNTYTDNAADTGEDFQTRFHAAIKKFLVKKGYMSKTEANGPEEWTVVNNASWTAYASNVYGLNSAPVPWNEDSIPAPLLADSDFEWGTAEAVTSQPAQTEPAQTEPAQTEPAQTEPAHEQQDTTEESDTSAEEPTPAEEPAKDTVFKVNADPAK